jgi:archaemetzincin
MARFDDDVIHPWWVRESRRLSSIVVFLACVFFGGATLLITQFEFGSEAVANSSSPDDLPAVGLGDVSPHAPDVAPYWRADPHHFEAMPEPRPGDWLHRFHEPGQTVEEYFAQGPNAVTRLSHVVYLQPLGTFDNDAPDLGVIAEYIELYFGLPTRILPAIEPAGRVTTRRTPWAVGGEQYLTTDLMRLLSDNQRDDAYATLGITMTDLYPADDWAFVFGQARLRERVAVHSFARYRPEAEANLTADEQRRRFLRRALKVTTHELGHAFGILHCTAHRCNMNGSNSLEETDESPIHLCPNDLQKIQTAVGWHPAERYAKLADFYEEQGLIDEARWTRSRLLSVH